MRLINADALKIESQKRQEGIERYGEEQADCFYSASRELSTEWWCVEDMIDNTPTVDPVKHGKWLKIEGCDTVQCSECFDDFDYIDGLCYLCHGQELPNYCPNCGAKMERNEDGKYEI